MRPSGLRIVAGEWRGRKLAVPKGGATRPTADRTRETLFNMLSSRLGSFEDLSVADLFAGSGALGLEALSRGAAHCLFVDEDKQSIDTIRANIDTFDARTRSTVQAGSVLALGPAKQQTDLILLDPPYGTGAGQVALDRMVRLGWIGPATWIALETARDEDIAIKSLAVEAERNVGKAKLTILRAD